MIMLATIILMMTLSSAAAQVECNRTFPVWQVCAASSKHIDPHAVVSPPDGGDDGDDGDHGKGKGKGQGNANGHEKK